MDTMIRFHSTAADLNASIVECDPFQEDASDESDLIADMLDAQDAYIVTSLTGDCVAIVRSNYSAIDPRFAR